LSVHPRQAADPSRGHIRHRWKVDGQPILQHQHPPPPPPLLRVVAATPAAAGGRHSSLDLPLHQPLFAGAEGADPSASALDFPRTCSGQVP